jgi:hypothetical protein
LGKACVDLTHLPSQPKMEEVEGQHLTMALQTIHEKGALSLMLEPPEATSNLKFHCAIVAKTGSLCKLMKIIQQKIRLK